MISTTASFASSRVAAIITPLPSAEDALAYLDSAPIPTVIKADGLALGKGVIIAATRDEAKEAVVEIMQ